MSDSLELSPRSGIVIFGILLLLEYGLFRTYVLRDIAELYPFGWDQPAYLIDAYVRYENILKMGFWDGLKASNLFDTATSFLFSTQAALYFLFFGASRFAALNINFIYWLMLQCLAYNVAFSITRKAELSLLFIGLLMAMAMPFFNAGGLLDFRVDFVAACLYGMLTCAVIKSGVFYDRKWSAIVAMFSIWLVLMRYFTILYLAGIFVPLFGYYYILMRRGKNATIQLGASQRIKHLSVAALIFTVIAAPFFWLARNAIYSYYIFNHIIGPEKYFRAKELRINGLLEHIQFYPPVFVKHHAGAVIINFALLAISLYVIFEFVRLLNRTAAKKTEGSIFYRDIFVFLIPAVVIPIFILTLDYSKSYVVPGIITVPFVWLFFLVYIYALEKGNISKKIKEYAGSIISITFVLAGFICFSAQLATHPRILARSNVHQIKAMYDTIAQYVHEAGMPEVYFSADAAADYYGKDILKVIGYENHGYIINAHPTPMGGSLFSITDEELELAINKSHVFIVNIYDDYPLSLYPLNNSLKNSNEKLKKLAQRGMIPLADFTFDGHYFRVYVKPHFSVQFLGGELGFNNRLLLTIPAAVANAAREVMVAGNLDAPTQQTFTVQAEVLDTQQPKEIAPIYEMAGGRYSVKIPLPNANNIKPLVISIQLARAAGLVIEQDQPRMLMPTQTAVLLNSGLQIDG